MVCAILLVLVISAGAFLVIRNGSDQAGQSTSSADPKNGDPKSGDPAGGDPIGGSGESNIEPGQPVTAEKLSKVLPVDFYYSMLRRQMVAPIGQLRSAYFGNEQDFLTRSGIYSITEVAIDHKTDRVHYGFSNYINKRGPGDIRCVNDAEMYWSDVLNAWARNKYQSAASCKRKPQGGLDGIVSSGLTDDQALKVIRELRNYEGFVNPAQPTLLSANGKTYIRQVVDFKPKKLSDGEYYGTALPMWAFKEAGLDPVKWPWSNPFGLAAGLHVVYYLDTATLMPVASFHTAVNNPSSDGSEVEQEGVQAFNYAFPKTLPTWKLGKRRETLTLNLPEGWKIAK